MQRSAFKFWIKRILLSAGIILVILTGVLAVHIYQVSNRPAGGVDGWQLARIDFKEPADSQRIAEIRDALHRMEGIYHSLANIEAGTLVYAYNPLVTDSELIFSSLVSATGIKAERFVVPENAVANACPVIDKNSISYRISSGFQKLFNNN